MCLLCEKTFLKEFSIVWSQEHFLHSNQSKSEAFSKLIFCDRRSYERIFTSSFYSTDIVNYHTTINSENAKALHACSETSEQYRRLSGTVIKTNIKKSSRLAIISIINGSSLVVRVCSNYMPYVCFNNYVERMATANSNSNAIVVWPTGLLATLTLSRRSSIEIINACT